MTIKTEILTLSFGALLILVTFGDAYIFPFVGNLDTMFGLKFWQALDMLYPLASISVFLLYGWVNGNGLKLNKVTAFLFISFIGILALVNIDDILQVLHISLNPSNVYWTVIMWAYPFYSAIAFILFGKTHKNIYDEIKQSN